MEESINRGEYQPNLAKQSSLRLGGSFKSTLSGRSNPRNSPSFRRLNSVRTPRKEGRISVGGALWIRSNHLLLWLLLITLWAYLGFFVQSRWAHSDKKEEFLAMEPGREIPTQMLNRFSDVICLLAINHYLLIMRLVQI